MKTLADAWSWYQSTRSNLLRMQRLASHHWDDPSLENSSLSQDEKFKTLEAEEIEEETTQALNPLDDLAVLVLFSVFEATVREYLELRIQPEASILSEPILKHAAQEAIVGVREGSFFNRVLNPLKQQGQVSSDLIDKVNQVRTYRNWVAHGKRTVRKKGDINIGPQEAYDRLKEFLDTLRIAIKPETAP